MSANMGVVKLTVGLSSDVVNALESIAKTRGITMTEALRQSISTEKFLMDTVNNKGKVLIEGRDKSIKQLVVR